MADDQAWAIGAQIGSERVRERRQRKAEARQEKIKMRDQLATKISSLEEGTPEHKQAKDLLVQVDTDLMDPNHPMPIEKIKNLLTGHFGHKQPAQPAPSVTTQVGGVSTPDISSGPSIPSAEHLLSVPALGQTAVSAPAPITIPEPPTEAPAAPTEAAQPPARNYASPDDTSGVVDPRQFRPSTPMLRRAFPAKPGFHLVTNPMEGQKAYYQSDSDPNDIREAKTGLKKKVSVEDASATTPASQKAATSDGSTPSASKLPKQPKDAINQFSNPEEQPREVSFAFNKGWAKHGPYATNLPADEEAEFRQWAAANPDSIRGEVGSGPDFKPIVDADYDVRGHFHAAKIGDPAASLTPNPWDGKIHGSDKFKTPYNGGFSRESMYALSTAPEWTKEGKLLTQDGRLVTDETPRTEAPTVAQGKPAAPSATTDTGQLPALPTPAVSIPGHDLTVKGPAQPKLSPRQQKVQSQAEQQAQLEIAAAGMTPEEQGTAQGRVAAAAKLFTFQAEMKMYDILHPEATAPNATPEAKQARQDHQNFLLEGASKTQNYKPDVQNLTLADGTQISSQWTPNPALPAKGSWQYLNGQNIESSQLAGARIAPKPTTKKGMKYDPQTGEVVDQDNLTRYSVTDVATGTVPPDVVKIFNDAKTTMDDKQKKALELATQRGNALGAGRYAPFIDPNNPTQVIAASYGEASKRGLHLALGAQYKTMEAMLRSSTSGPIAEQMVQFGTAFQHADLLEQAATDLHNGNNRAINLIKNDWITAFGGETPTDFKVIATAYTREVNKALSSGHVTDAELSEVGATIPQNASLDQIYGAVRAYRKLMQSKIQIRAAQIEAGMHGAPYMGPGAQPPNTGGGRPKGAIGTFPHNGKNYWVDAQGNNLGVAP